MDCHLGKTAQNQSRYRYGRTKKMLQTDVFIGQANTNENNAQQYSYDDGDLREKWYGKIRQRQKIEGAHISRQKVRGKGNVAYYAKGGWKWSYWIHDYNR